MKPTNLLLIPWHFIGGISVLILHPPSSSCFWHDSIHIAASIRHEISQISDPLRFTHITLNGDFAIIHPVIVEPTFAKKTEHSGSSENIVYSSYTPDVCSIPTASLVASNSPFFYHEELYVVNDGRYIFQLINTE